MERSVSGAVGVGVRPFLEKERREHSLIAVRRQHEGRRARWRGILDVGAGRQQSRRGFNVTHSCGKQQRCEAALLGVLAAV